MAKVLVTGGTGFVAGWCIVRLLDQGHEVRTTVRRSAQADDVRKTISSAGRDGGAIEFVQADLLGDAGWSDAMAGCDYVLHVASPMVPSAKDFSTVINPARDGTLRILRAAVEAGVKRVVMTSSAAACNPGSKTETFTDETVWTNPDLWRADAYRMSKVLSERAAWDFIEKHGGTTELTTIIPAAIFGPALGASARSSLLIIDRMLAGAMPGVPGVGMCITDVRDLADMHIAAMTSPAAKGERLIVTGEFVWMKDIAALLRHDLGEAGANVPHRVIPDFLVRLSSMTNPQLKSLVPMLGRKTRYNSAKAQRLLGYQPRPANEVLLDTARSLLPAAVQPSAA